MTEEEKEDAETKKDLAEERQEWIDSGEDPKDWDRLHDITGGMVDNLNVGD